MLTQLARATATNGTQRCRIEGAACTELVSVVMVEHLGLTFVSLLQNMAAPVAVVVADA